MHRWPHPSAMAAPCLEFDAASELELLYREAAWQSGQNAKTLVSSTICELFHGEHDDAFRERRIATAAAPVIALLVQDEGVESTCRRTPSSRENRRRRRRRCAVHRATGDCGMYGVTSLERVVTRSSGMTTCVRGAARFSTDSARESYVVLKRRTLMPSKRNNDEERVARIDHLVEQYRTNAERVSARVDTPKTSRRSHEPGDKKHRKDVETATRGTRT